MQPLKRKCSPLFLRFTPISRLWDFLLSQRPKSDYPFAPSLRPLLHSKLMFSCPLSPTSFSLIDAPSSSLEKTLQEENQQLKAKIKQLQSVMDRELQDTDNQFFEKVNELRDQHSKKIEEVEAFAQLAAQEAQVSLPSLPSPPNSSLNCHFSLLISFNISNPKPSS